MTHRSKNAPRHALRDRQDTARRTDGARAPTTPATAPRHELAQAEPGELRHVVVLGYN